MRTAIVGYHTDRTRIGTATHSLATATGAREAGPGTALLRAATESPLIGALPFTPSAFAGPKTALGTLTAYLTRGRQAPAYVRATPQTARAISDIHTGLRAAVIRGLAAITNDCTSSRRIVTRIVRAADSRTAIRIRAARFPLNCARLTVTAGSV